MSAQGHHGGTTLSLLEHALFPEAPPPRIGRFEVRRQLGRGGMGVVYLAFDPELKRNVALKVHPSDAAPRTRLGIRKEAESLARLEHRNVVTVFEVGQDDDGQVFVVMEYLRGRTLDVWVREAQPDARTITSTLIECARGLAAAHAAGLVHRDFKPTNVIVDDDGTPKIIDFGLATERDEPISEAELARSAGAEQHDRTQTALAGTPRYMAPELWRGAPPSANTDQFSWCASLFELLVGVGPYSDTRTAQRVPARPRELDRALWSVVGRGLSPEPTERFPSIEALIARLDPRPSGPAWRPWSLAAGLGVLAIGGMVLAGQRPTAVLSPSPAAGVVERPPPCTIGEDFLASTEAWQADVPERLSFPPGQLRLAAGPEYVHARTRRLISLDQRALDVEVVHAPTGGKGRELIVGIEDREHRLIAGILIIEGRWVFPLAPGLRGLELELGPEDRHFRLQFEQHDQGFQTISYAFGDDGQDWRPIARTAGRLDHAYLLVATGTREPTDRPDEARVAALRCAAPQPLGPLDHARDLSLLRGR
ncbi:serine/threonine-protein kinase [Paraliomyxa miuraensis]|uniref:serine/threonine-protein kinase n=1 Tax=Paraliomyxa miuraensis TaxID=376150 RepID=UPI002251F7F4|nr:serine/threonine-protein kinase [Paraliomyxa miuraensis]MCX4240957.1 serine/threonine protein kinase [Paraliomyxa miuraensis]